VSAATIRPVSVAMCLRDGRLLVERGSDPATGQVFVRAIGGAIEFGELALDTVTREWKEEYGLTLRELHLLGVLENRFHYDGNPGHEIAFVFQTTEPVGSPEIGAELRRHDPAGAEHVALWVPISDLERQEPPLYPTGALRLVNRAR
jgi:ADP-ribose pyrophosphatase YjhB (NUDIX family)